MLAIDQMIPSVQAQAPKVEEVVVVFKTHFDIGYTDLAANVVQRTAPR